MSDLVRAILSRRTSKPITFAPTPPAPNLVRKFIDIARNAPNHHRTEPARFYLLNPDKIKKVGQLFGEVIAGDRSDSQLVERGKKKANEWGNAPGLLIITCFTDKDSELFQKKPSLTEENYATCCCITQNLLLLFEKEGISTKWSTGPIWEHEKFAETIDLSSSVNEKVVALLFYGYCEKKPTNRSLTPIENHLTEFH